MSGNSFGKIFRITTFGESHGKALGVVIDGCPANLPINLDEIQKALDRRKPGATIGGIKNISGTQRNEKDQAKILSGVFEGFSTGTPIAIVIENNEQHSSDYENLKNTFRPGHADFTYEQKYTNRDYRGGGRSSGRETAARVAAGAVAEIILKQYGIKTTAYTIRAAGVSCKEKNLQVIEKNSLRACDLKAATLMEEKIKALKEEGESTGGIVECVIQNVPLGLGEPVFNKLEAVLSHAILSIGAIKGIEFGSGFLCADLKGSECNDQMTLQNGKPYFLSNNAGGILGGISNGNHIVFRAAVKPVPSIFKTQKTIQKNDDTFSNTNLLIQGRHDTCLCPRIVPVVEAMTNIVLADMLLQNKCTKA